MTLSERIRAAALGSDLLSNPTERPVEGAQAPLPTPYDLAALRLCADKACDAAYLVRNDIDGAINWGDLSCVEARKWSADGGEEGYTVLIEEADPGAQELREFIANELFKAGFVDVDVEIEW